MTNVQDLYTILGVPSNASTDDIRRAYRLAARRLHPDANHHPGAGNQFRDIAAAYEILGNSDARLKYDQQRSNENEPSYFALRVTPSKRVLATLQEPQVVYLLVELQPDRKLSQQSQANVTPLNLTIVIDRSTSMKGLRLDRTKIAAYQIIDQLSEADVLSVVAFSDRAEVLVKAAPVMQKANTKAMITPLQASGATELLQGLTLGLQENRRHAAKKYVNHIILITDGRTIGDEQPSLELAAAAAKEGIGISALGIGEDWNDVFLDQLVSSSGGSTQYINSPNAVVTFLNERVRALTQALAERVTLSLAPDPDVKLEFAFRLSPNPQPLPVESDPIQVGQLVAGSSISILLQLQMPPLPKEEIRSLIRVETTGDIMRMQRLGYKSIADTTLEVIAEPPPEDPPIAILDALGKLTLYRMQQKAVEAVASGHVNEATKRFEKLATRLFDAGQPGLADAALSEARRISGGTSSLSDQGQKALKFGTRRLMLPAPTQDVERLP